MNLDSFSALLDATAVDFTSVFFVYCSACFFLVSACFCACFSTDGLVCLEISATFAAGVTAFTFSSTFLPDLGVSDLTRGLETDLTSGFLNSSLATCFTANSVGLESLDFLGETDFY